MTRIKICGLKRIEDIEAVNELCPDYVGFVFADFSHRYVDKEAAVKLKERLDPRIKAVGVFVNEDYNYVAELLNEGVIDMAQLHGDEDEVYIERLRGLTSDNEREAKSADSEKIIKAFNMSKIGSVSEIDNSSADMVLVDSGTGSGKTFDWTRLSEIKRPYILAGGLGVQNIAEAVNTLQPYGVDVSSGVETDKLKDVNKMRSFVEIVRKGKA
ncbi:MAG: phosphoribosylanthranilate isomerase [Eubacterium sp.]|nr:phosphoribosylanthranilate isomerase [Eubacterium sp.]